MRQRRSLRSRFLLLLLFLGFLWLNRFLRHFGEVVGLGEEFEELLGFSGSESEELDDVEAVFFGDVVADLVFLEETSELVELLFGVGFDGGVHIAAAV